MLPNSFDKFGLWGSEFIRKVEGFFFFLRAFFRLAGTVSGLGFRVCNRNPGSKALLDFLQRRNFLQEKGSKRLVYNQAAAEQFYNYRWR